MPKREAEIEFEGAHYLVRFRPGGKVSSVQGWRDLGHKKVRYDLWTCQAGRVPGPKTKKIIEAARGAK